MRALGGVIGVAAAFAAVAAAVVSFAARRRPTRWEKKLVEKERRGKARRRMKERMEKLKQIDLKLQI